MDFSAKLDELISKAKKAGVDLVEILDELQMQADGIDDEIASLSDENPDHNESEEA